MAQHSSVYRISKRAVPPATDNKGEFSETAKKMLFRGAKRKEEVGK